MHAPQADKSASNMQMQIADEQGYAGNTQELQRTNTKCSNS